jgi:hypothetical protein
MHGPTQSPTFAFGHTQVLPEHHENAAKAHRTAADRKGDHEAGHKHSQELSRNPRGMFSRWYTPAVTEQAMVDHIAAAAKPRFLNLLKLRVRHVHELTAGIANEKLVVEGSEVEFKLVKVVQLYKDIERFMGEDKLTGFIVTPGVLPIVKAISMDMRGRRMLVTRNTFSRPDEKEVYADLDDFGIRVMMKLDEGSQETTVLWECLYGVA